MKKSRFSNNILLYLGNNTRYGHMERQQEDLSNGAIQCHDITKRQITRNTS